MNLRKIIKEEVGKVLLNENQSYLPKQFDHLKWELNNNQRYYLSDLCNVDPNSLKESDIKNASKFLGIPEKNVKSIINTYGTYNPMKEAIGDSEAARNSALTMGNAPATAKDIGLSVDDSRLPDFEYPMGRQMHTNPPNISKIEMKRKYEADQLNRTWYREGEGKEHPSKKIERMYESLTQSLMLYLYCESKPKDINLRSDDKIQIDFEPIINEGEFNQLKGGSSYETEKHKEIKRLVEEFNEKFGCSFVIYDHVNLEDCQRIYVEHNVTKQVDMSKDSMAMMKRFLLPKIMMGQKITPENAEIASLLGLDAGDTSWLYGPIGQTPKSGIISKR